MMRFLLSRLFQVLAVLAVMSFVIYALIGLMPGDPIDLMISGNPKISSEDAARLRALQGLDQPLLDRYINWFVSAINGDFGYSRLLSKPVFQAIGPAFINTLKLMSVVFVVSLLIALPLGILASRRPRSRLDYIINLVAFAGVSVPPFWLAILLIILFSVTLGWLPAGGVAMDNNADFFETVKYFIMPVVALTIANIGSHTRYMRASMIETLKCDYIRTAKAKGVPENKIMLGHALRNALMPVVTIIALDFGNIFSGALITETVFSIPGMGKLIYDAIMGNDFNLALVALLFATFMTLAGNFIADIAYVVLDPRLSFSGQKK